MMDGFIGKVKQALEESGVAGSIFTEGRLRQVLDGFANDLTSRITQIGGAGIAGNVAEEERRETGRGYTIHTYGGSFRRVPQDWRFPRVGVHSVWRQWWIGDTIRNIPPLCSLTNKDLSHLDDVPLAEVEMPGRNGRHKNKRRPASKTLSDLKFLMEYITSKVQEAGALATVITLTNVDVMFTVVFEEFEGGRNAQKNWQSVAQDIRRRQRAGREALVN
jgi:hypothetical protein